MRHCKLKWEKKVLGSICGYIATGKLDANAMVDGGEYRFYTCAENYYQIDTYAFEGQSLLISGNGANVGYVHYYNGKFNAYQRTYVLQNFQENIFYLKHYLKTYLKNRIAKEVNAGNIPFIKLNTLTDMNIFYPVDKTEQEKIAKILSTCDSVIEKTEETIEKYKQIKVGMMQDLFTRGLDESGKLRPKYQDAPELYKYSEELERYIPKDWDVNDLEYYTNLIKDGTHGTHKDVDNGIPLLSAKDIVNGNVLVPNDCRRISKKDYDNIHKNYKLELEDVLLTIVGTIGRTAVIKNIDKSYTFQRSVAVIKLKNTKYSDYFYYYFSFEDTQKQLSSMMNASAQGGLYLGQLSKIQISIPNKEDEIFNIKNQLLAIDSKIKLEQQYLSKYKQIKQGLMKKLLTPPADAEIVEE